MLAVICTFVFVATACAAPQQGQARLAVVQPALIRLAAPQQAQVRLVAPAQSAAVGLNTQYQYTQQAAVSGPIPVQQVQAVRTLQPAPEVVQSAAVPQPLLKNYQVNEPQPIAIIRSNVDSNFDGNFIYDFETENGILIQATGTLKEISPKEQAQVIQGSYTYTAPDGTLITTTYTADENGFVVQGDHLPVAPQEPELPPLIAKSLAYIRSLPPLPENQQ